MPSYHVEFAPPSGERSGAALDAPSLPALARRLEAHGCALLRVLPPRPERVNRDYFRRISEAEVTTLLRQLAGMLENGIALAPALALAARETHNYTLRGLLLEVERSLREGGTLSHALCAYPRLFTPLYVRLLEAGEAGNRLPEVLRQVADHAERASQAATRIRTALVYPQVVGVITLILMTFTFLYVAPQFRNLFNELGLRGESLPLATKALFWFSSTLVPVLAVGVPLAAVIVGLLYWREQRQAPFMAAYRRTRLPIVGTLYHHLALLRLTRLLSALLRGGVPLLEAMRLAGQGSENALLQAAMWDAIPRVAAGESLGRALGHSGILPPTFCGQVAAAETSDDLPGALARMGDAYGERVDYLAARISALLEPVFILLLAGFAVWIALAVFAPFVSLIQGLSGGGF